MVEDLIKRLRERAPNAETGDDSCLMELASDAIEQQAARLTALESERDALLAAAGKEAGAIYQVQTSCNGWTDHSREEYEGARLPRRVVYTAPAAALENGDGRDAWQPIETAPKDKEIWAFNGEQGRMLWSEGNQWALWVWADELLSDVDPEPNQPTHWQPLPAPPAALSQKSGEQQ